VIRRSSESKINKLNRADESRQQNLDDGNVQLNGKEVEMKHPIGVGTLDRLFKMSNTLGQCVNAYVVNITGFGHRIVAADKDFPADPVEKQTLKSWLKHFNTDRSFAEENRSQVFEYEKYGGRYMEIVRGKNKKPTLARHTPYLTVKQQSKQKKAITVERTIDRGGNRVLVKEKKRFRRYIQRIGGTTTYFKEFGDPRDMDYRTGRYATRDKKVPVGFHATELLFKKQESESIYGEPRWYPMAPVILGIRESEEVNLRFFEDNTVPNAFITISGGRLTEESFRDIRELVESSNNKHNAITLIEAISESGGLDDKSGTVQINVEKMTSERQSDGLFAEYDEAGQSKIQSVFRLPGVVLGKSQDATFATANIAAFVAEMQVFSPERASHDDWLNNSFVNHEMGLNLKTVKIESRGPSLTAPQDIVKALTAGNVMGAVTPRTAVELLNEQLMVGLEPYPEENEDGYLPWMDQPLALSLRLAGMTDDKDNDIDRTSVESEISDSESDERDTEEGNNVTSLDNRRG